MNPGQTEEERALARKNYITAAWLVAFILLMASTSYWFRSLMVPVLFKT